MSSDKGQGEALFSGTGPQDVLGTMIQGWTAYQLEQQAGLGRAERQRLANDGRRQEPLDGQHEPQNSAKDVPIQFAFAAGRPASSSRD